MLEPRYGAISFRILGLARGYGLIMVFVVLGAGCDELAARVQAREVNLDLRYLLLLLLR